MERWRDRCVLLFDFSGGHTTEMIRLLGSLSVYYQPRIYVLAETDKMSAEKITSFEKNRTGEVSSMVCWAAFGHLHVDSNML